VDTNSLEPPRKTRKSVKNDPMSEHFRALKPEPPLEKSSEKADNVAENDVEMVEASEEEVVIPSIEVSLHVGSPTPSFLDPENLSDVHSGYDSSTTTRTEKKPRRARVPRQMTEVVSDSDQSTSKRRAESDADQPGPKRRREGTSLSFDGRAYRRDGVHVPAGLENPFRKTNARSLHIDEQEDMRDIREGLEKIEKSKIGLESRDARQRSKTPSRKDILSPKRTTRKQKDVEDNDDHCSTCRGTTGDLICCDDCPKSFHGYCCDPPIDPDNVPEGSWICKTCSLSKKPVAAPTVGRHPWKRGLWSALFEKLNSQAVKLFKLPPAIANSFSSTARNPATGDYIDLNEYSVVPRFSGVQQQTLIENLRKEAATAICFKCSRSGGSGPGGGTTETFGYLAGMEPVIIRCDYCPLWWHLDCLDPPLTHLVNVSAFPLDEALHESELGLQHSPARRGRKVMPSDVAHDDRKLHELAFGTDTYWTQGIVPAPATTGHALGLRRRWMCPCHSTWEQRKVDVLLERMESSPQSGSDSFKSEDTHVQLKGTFDIDAFREDQPKLFPHRQSLGGPLTLSVSTQPSNKPWNHGEINIVTEDSNTRDDFLRGIEGGRNWARFLVDDHAFEVSEARVKMEFLNKCHEYVYLGFFGGLIFRDGNGWRNRRDRGLVGPTNFCRDIPTTTESPTITHGRQTKSITTKDWYVYNLVSNSKKSGSNPFQRFSTKLLIYSIHPLWNPCVKLHWVQRTRFKLDWMH
jgi:hypothetical protein